MKRSVYSVFFFLFSFLAILGLSGIARASQLYTSTVVAAVGLTGSAVFTILLQRERKKLIMRQASERQEQGAKSGGQEQRKG